MKLAPPGLSALLLLAACTAQVSHPTKTLAEQQADVDFCTKAANQKYWMDPIAALLNAYDCLRRRGIRRRRAASRNGRTLAGDDATGGRDRGEPQKPFRSCVGSGLEPPAAKRRGGSR